MVFLRMLITLWVFGSLPVCLALAVQTQSGWAVLCAVLTLWPWVSMAGLQVAVSRGWFVPAGDVLHDIGRLPYVFGAWRVDGRRAPKVLVERMQKGLMGFTWTPGHLTLRWNLTHDDATVTHEAHHLRWMAILGPLFMYVYGAASVISWMRGRGMYVGNAFERAARKHAGQPV